MQSRVIIGITNGAAGMDILTKHLTQCAINDDVESSLTEEPCDKVAIVNLAFFSEAIAKASLDSVTNGLALVNSEIKVIQGNEDPVCVCVCVQEQIIREGGRDGGGQRERR